MTTKNRVRVVLDAVADCPKCKGTGLVAVPLQLRLLLDNQLVAVICSCVVAAR